MIKNKITLRRPRTFKLNKSCIVKNAIFLELSQPYPCGTDQALLLQGCLCYQELLMIHFTHCVSLFNLL